MDKNGFLTSDSSDTTWIKPLGRNWKEVTYAAVEGLAVFEGCIILGTVTQAQADKQSVKDNPGIVQPGAEHFGIGIRGTQFRWKNNIIPYEIGHASAGARPGGSQALARQHPDQVGEAKSW